MTLNSKLKYNKNIQPKIFSEKGGLFRGVLVNVAEPVQIESFKFPVSQYSYRDI